VSPDFHPLKKSGFLRRISLAESVFGSNQAFQLWFSQIGAAIPADNTRDSIALRADSIGVIKTQKKPGAKPKQATHQAGVLSYCFKSMA
jgi:hypothetical protein